jgi:lysophospholipase L1-like esterase
MQDIRICFVGDSFVNGTGDETCLGWTGRVCAAAWDRGREVTCYNLGIRRDTTRDIRRRWESECARRLPAHCDARLVISCGVNDTMLDNGAVRVAFEESCSNLRRILVGAKEYEVVLVGPPPVPDDGHNERIRRLSSAFAQEAGLLGIPYIELYPALASDGAYRTEIASTDGAHPRSGGYTRIAHIVASSKHWWFSNPSAGVSDPRPQGR